jgi:hypothetical protein
VPETGILIRVRFHSLNAHGTMEPLPSRSIPDWIQRGRCLSLEHRAHFPGALKIVAGLI